MLLSISFWMSSVQLNYLQDKNSFMKNWQKKHTLLRTYLLDQAVLTILSWGGLPVRKLVVYVGKASVDTGTIHVFLISCKHFILII